jgi:hypothetical protein
MQPAEAEFERVKADLAVAQMHRMVEEALQLEQQQTVQAAAAAEAEHPETQAHRQMEAKAL